MYLRITLLFLVILHVSAYVKVKGKRKVLSAVKSTYEDSSDDSDYETDSDDDDYDDDDDDDDYDDSDDDSDDDRSEYTSSDYESEKPYKEPTRTGKAVAGKGQYRYLIPNCTGETSEEREFALKAYKEHMKDQGFPSNYDERRINMQLHPENYEEEEEYSLTEEYVETTSTTTTQATTTVMKRRRKPVRSRALTLPTGKLRRGRRLKRQADAYVKSAAVPSLTDYFGFNRFKEWIMKGKSLKLKT